MKGNVEGVPSFMVNGADGCEPGGIVGVVGEAFAAGAITRAWPSPPSGAPSPWISMGLSTEPAAAADIVTAKNE